MYLTDFAQVKPGLRWSHARFGFERHWELWRQGQVESLWLGYTWPDGLGFAKDFYQFYNWFSLVTEFYSEAVGGDDAILDPVLRDGAEVILQLAESYSVKGYGVVRHTKAGVVYAVDPSHWAPVLSQSDRSVELGHVLAYEWRQLEANEQPGDNTTPNRIDFHLCPYVGETWWVRHLLDGQVVGRQLNGGPSGVKAVYAFGDGKSDYADIATPSREFAVRMSGAARVLGRHMNPHLMGPSSALVPGDDGVMGVNISGAGRFLPVADRDDPEYQYVVWDGSLRANESAIQRIVDYIHTKTGIPLESGGVSRGIAESGISREQASFKAVSRVRRTRRLIEWVLGRCGVSVAWQLDPFESKTERSAAVVAQVTTGILSRQAGARLLGYEEADVGEPTATAE